MCEYIMKFGDETMELKGRKVTLARIVSRLTAAPLINFYAGIIISISTYPALGPILNPWSNMIICTLLMVIAPVAPIVFQAKRGKVDLDVSKQEQRLWFFVFGIFCYLAAYGVYWFLNSDVMRILAAAYVAVTTGVTVVNGFTKVSVHAAGIAGPSTALIFMYGIPALPVIGLWCLVVWARSILKQHSIVQGIIGIILGMSITAVTYFLLYPL